MATSVSLPALTFWDVTSKTPTEPWSPFTTRTLLSLNALSLSYIRTPISYPDIASTLQKEDVPPAPNTEDEAIRWTLPALTLGYPKQGSREARTETVMDSFAIAKILADLPTDKNVFPGEAGVKGGWEVATRKLDEAILAGLEDFWIHVIPFVPFNILDERGAEYFIEKREPKFGNLADRVKEAETQDFGAAVKKAATFMLDVYTSFDGEVKAEGGGEGEDGKGDADFMFGAAEPSYPDFVLVGQLQWWIKSRGRDPVLSALGDVGDGRLLRVFEACEHLLKPTG